MVDTPGPKPEPRPDILAVVGHELRSPLAALLVSAELLGQELDQLDHQQLSQLVDQLQRRARGLQVLVDNLLHTARSGACRVQSAPLDTHELVADVQLTVEPFLAAAQQRLEVNSAPLQLVGDHGRLVQVLVNLVLNASKFSPPQTCIELSFERAGAAVRVDVADRGPGLPESAVDWLFQPYARAHPGTAGLGLGLAVVRSIVEAHGGHVGATNRPGGGARFWFTLPRRSDTPTSPVMRRSGGTRCGSGR